MNRNPFLMILLLSCIIGCTEKDIPCTTFPCGEENNYLGNRVAYDPDFRIGTWVNVDAASTSRDTLVFHNDSIWSNFYYRFSTGQIDGIFYKKYKFINTSIEFYDGYSGTPLDRPARKRTIYNDTLGIFSILHLIIPGGSYQDWSHYIKIE